MKTAHMLHSSHGIAPHGYMLLATFLVATSFTVGSHVAGKLDSTVLILLRFGLAALLFTPILFWRVGWKLPSWRALGGYSLISLTLVEFFWLMFESLRFTTAINTGTLYTIVPGLTGILAYFLLGEPLHKPRILALGLGLVGAIVVIYGGRWGALAALSLNRGDGLFLLACGLMAMYNPLIRRFYRGEPMIIMTYWVLLTGIGWLLPLTIPKLAQVNWAAVQPSVWGGVAYLAAGPTLITFFLIQYCTVRLGATKAIAYSYLNPAFVVLIHLGLLHPLPPLSTWMGIVITATAMIIMQRSSNQHPTK